MACSKTFNITITEDDPCVVDCDGAPPAVSGLSWVVVENDDPGGFGDAILSAAGASGAFSITGAITNVQGGESVATGTFTARFCNNTSTDRSVLLTFMFDWSVSVTAAIGVGGSCGITMIKVPDIFFQQSVALSPFESGTNAQSNTGEVVPHAVDCPACSVTEFIIDLQCGGNAGGPISDPASLSYSLVGTFAVTLV